MSRRATIIGWGILLLLLPACTGTGRRNGPTVASSGVISSPASPSAYTILGQNTYAPTPPRPAKTAPVQGQVTASANPGEKRFQFTRPPREAEVEVTAAPKELPVRLSTVDPEEKVVAKSSPPVEPIREEQPPYELPKIATTKAAPVAPRVEPTPPVATGGISGRPAQTIEPKPEIAPTESASNVVAPEWPTIGPASNIVKAPASLSIPVRVVSEPSPTPRSPLEEIKAPPYPTLQAVSTSPDPVPTVDPVVKPLPVPETPLPKVVPEPVPTLQVQREAIREIVKETLKELPVEAPRREPVPVPVPQPAPAVSESPLVLAIRAYQAKDSVAAIAHLKQFDPRNQELLLSLMPLLVRLGEGSVSSMTPEELAMHLDQLQGASSALKSRAALKAETVCFCKRVHKYGKYDAIEPDHIYQPAEPVEVYFELRNFTWETGRSEDKAFAMRLGSTLEIRDSRKQVVWRRDLTTTDSRQTPPSDYYLVYRFTLPELPPGAYTLEVQVVDQLDSLRRNARRSLELRVGSKP